jgi:hypothetical protein
MVVESQEKYMLVLSADKTTKRYGAEESLVASSVQFTHSLLVSRDSIRP